MTFSDFCDMTKPIYFGYASQSNYLKDLFKAANIQRTYAETYLKLVYDGHKHLNSNMKKHFPRPVNKSAIAQFFEKNIKKEYIGTVCDAFGVPVDLERNSTYLSMALAEQVCAFITSKEEDLGNIVPEEYINARIQHEKRDFHIESVAYEGDNIWTEDRFKKHSVKCYEHFQHTWVIHNQGTVQWHQRKLVCTNIDEISPEISDTVIQLPDIPPNGYKKITTNIDARGCEGHFISKWDMQDSSGNNCFPRSSSLFDISIDVTFDPENAEV